MSSEILVDNINEMKISMYGIVHNHYRKSKDTKVWDQKRINAYKQLLDIVIYGSYTICSKKLPSHYSALDKITWAVSKGYKEVNLLEFNSNTRVPENDPKGVRILGLIYHTKYNAFYKSLGLNYIIDELKTLLFPYNIRFWKPCKDKWVIQATWYNTDSVKPKFDVPTIEESKDYYNDEMSTDESIRESIHYESFDDIEKNDSEITDYLNDTEKPIESTNNNTSLDILPEIKPFQIKPFKIKPIEIKSLNFLNDNKFYYNDIESNYTEKLLNNNYTQERNENITENTETIIEDNTETNISENTDNTETNITENTEEIYEYNENYEEYNLEDDKFQDENYTDYLDRLIKNKYDDEYDEEKYEKEKYGEEYDNEYDEEKYDNEYYEEKYKYTEEIKNNDIYTINISDDIENDTSELNFFDIRKELSPNDIMINNWLAYPQNKN